MTRSGFGRWMLGIAVAALSLAPVLAQPGGGPHRGWGHGPEGETGMVEHLAQALDLTADQRTTIRQIVAKYEGGALGNHMDAMRTAHRALAEAVHNPAATDDQVQQAAATVATQSALVAVDQHHMAVEIYAVLTPEQQQKFATLRHETHGMAPGPPADVAGHD